MSVTGETKKRLLLSKWRSDQESGVEMRDSDDDRAETLEQVRWWFLESLVHHRPMRDPRVILRQIENVLR